MFVNVEKPGHPHEIKLNKYQTVPLDQAIRAVILKCVVLLRMTKLMSANMLESLFRVHVHTIPIVQCFQNSENDYD